MSLALGWSGSSLLKSELVPTVDAALEDARNRGPLYAPDQARNEYVAESSGGITFTFTDAESGEETEVQLGLSLSPA